MIDRKIYIKNIYYMLAYAFKALEITSYAEVDKESFDNIADLFSAVLSQGLSVQLKRGLHKEYIEKVDDIPGLRGHIQMAGTIRHLAADERLLTCEFDELSEDNIFNQIIKTTSMYLIESKDVKPELKNSLKQKMLFFSDIHVIDPKLIRWDSLRFQRNNQSYRILISICQLVLEGMLVTESKGKYKLAQFIDTQVLNKLYEKFILEYYRREFKGRLTANASQIPWDFTETEGTLLPIMQSDIMLSNNEKVLIIDAKYYQTNLQDHYDKQSIISGNLYQIYTYVDSKKRALAKEGEKKSVSGMLLYAKTDDEVSPDGKNKMSDGSYISVSTLDLGQDFSEIKNKLNQLAEGYFT